MADTELGLNRPMLRIESFRILYLTFESVHFMEHFSALTVKQHFSAFISLIWHGKGYYRRGESNTSSACLSQSSASLSNPIGMLRLCGEQLLDHNRDSYYAFQHHIRKAVDDKRRHYVEYGESAVCYENW